MHVARFARAYLPWIKCVVFISSLTPALALLFQYYTDSLGINKLNTLLHTTGRWALIFLLITLTITPFRRISSSFCIHIHSRYGKRLSDWNWIIRLRRMLGLYSLFYAASHFLIYIWFDQAMDGEGILLDLMDRPFIVLGFGCFVLLVSLGVTSTDSMIKKLGKHWRRLHRLIYAIGVGAVLHYWWLAKVGNNDPLPYTIILTALLGYRVLNKFGFIFRNVKDTGMEVAER